VFIIAYDHEVRANSITTVVQQTSCNDPSYEQNYNMFRIRASFFKAYVLK
jgi:hypothetical protein